MNNVAKKSLLSMRNSSDVAELAAWLAILATGATIFLLVSLHVLSPEFSPSWRVISEYALGHYPWWSPSGPRSTPIPERWGCGF